MKNNGIKIAMIRNAIRKGIQDIKEDSGRGIRNLVELGEMFSHGRFQKDFFHIVFEQLKKQDTAYYKLVELVVSQVDPEIFENFGINLGYRSLSYGAEIIRNIEKNQGFNVPWCISLDTGNSDIYLSPSDIESIIHQGNDLGIYTYPLYIQSDYPKLPELLEMLLIQKNCALIFFLHPRVVDDRFCNILAEGKNAAAVLELDHAEFDELDHAAKILTDHGILTGTFSHNPDISEKNINQSLLSDTEKLGLTIYIIIKERGIHPLKGSIYHSIVTLRTHNSIPVLPFDFYGDIVHVDKIISSDPCIAIVNANGKLILMNEEEESLNQCSIYEYTLIEAFKTFLPKYI